MCIAMQKIDCCLRHSYMVSFHIFDMGDKKLFDSSNYDEENE